jgi:hypothetical protein
MFYSSLSCLWTCVADSILGYLLVYLFFISLGYTLGIVPQHIVLPGCGIPTSACAVPDMSRLYWSVLLLDVSVL